MTTQGRDTDRIMDRFLKELGEPLPSTIRMRRATQRVLENLSSFDRLAASTADATTLSSALPKRRWTTVAAVAAALLAAAVLVGTLSLPSSAEPIARRLNGKFVSSGDTNGIEEGKVIQTGDGGEILGLRDGSRVEMSGGVKLSINRAADGIQVDLNEGNIIVTAAKQRNGHLYVKTRDCVVSVVGTVFSVNAEASGSRVAVIEGEVHVQHGDVSQTLLPGQQVATNAEMKTVPIQSEIGWSQDAATQVAMLQQASVPASPAAQAPVATGATPANPDGTGDAVGPVEKNKTFFYSLWAQNAQGLTAETRAGTLRVYQNWAAAPSGFTFSISGIQGRTISFSNSKGEMFSYGCADCSFVVSENGVSKNLPSTEPGIEFKLSADGTSLTATCHAATCSMGRWYKSTSWAVNGGAVDRWSAGVAYTLNRTSREAPQVFTIPTSQLMQQQGGSVLFVVTKPAGQ